MKKNFILAVLVSAFILAFAGIASANNIAIENQTGRTILELYMSSSNASDWEEDLLGDKTLPHNTYFDIKWQGQPTGNWDIKAVFSDGNSLEWKNLDISKANRVVLGSDGRARWS